MKKLLQNFMERLAYDGLTIEEMSQLAGGGGKSAPTIPPPPPAVAPKPPVQEASVQLDENATKKRARTSKSTLKMPLASTASGTGLNL